MRASEKHILIQNGGTLILFLFRGYFLVVTATLKYGYKK